MLKSDTKTAVFVEEDQEDLTCGRLAVQVVYSALYIPSFRVFDSSNSYEESELRFGDLSTSTRRLRCATFNLPQAPPLPETRTIALSLEV
jgi:hypothetical protein